MVAATTDRSTDSLGPVRIKEYAMADDITILEDVAVMINSAGFAVEAVAGAGNKGVVGAALQNTVNPAGGSVKIRVQEGTFRFVGVALTQSEVGDTVFFSDNQTFSNVQGANEPQGGKLVKFDSATSGWVQMGVAVAS